MEPSELLSYLAEGLVDDPEQVEVERFEEDDGTVILELAVGPDDYGKVIGRGGRTAARFAPSWAPRLPATGSAW